MRILIETVDYSNKPIEGTNWNRVVNDVTPVTATGVWIANLIDDAEELTGFSLECTSAFFKIEQVQPPAPLFGYSETVWGYGLSTPNSATSTLEITGLPDGEPYTLTTGGFSGSPTRDTKYTVDGVVYDSIASDGTDAPVVHTGIVSGGKITLSAGKADVNGQYYGFISFIDLLIGTDPITIDSISDGTIDLGEQGVVVTRSNSTGAATNVTLNGIDQVFGNEVDQGGGVRTLEVNVTGYVPDGVNSLVVTE